MMLARVADSLYWTGRYVERAEHISRLAAVMLNATLDRTDAGAQAAHIALTAVGERDPARLGQAVEAARALVLAREDAGSVLVSLARARENARQVRDQITTETWERLNLLYLRVTGADAEAAFADDAASFLAEIIADLHLFKGAADATMSHGEGWRFMLTGVYIERAQLMARLLETCFADGARAVSDHIALMSLLRMGCALEPYLRAYTADINPRYILEFLLFDEDFPRSIRFSTERIEEHLAHLSHRLERDRAEALRLAGRLNARLKFADAEEVGVSGAGQLLGAVADECASIHEAIWDTFVAYPLELSLPA
ncbi:MAG TPA: alpha-E domain-containing protein [Caulobacteraceae bacterium]|nr:alpha-E domain-containing protein [Caulobacteraceae bacterium]